VDAPGDFPQIIEHAVELRGYVPDLGMDLATFGGCRRCRTQPQGQRDEALLGAAVPSSSNLIILAVPLPKCRNTSFVTAANTASGGSPRATSMASRRSDACGSASSRKFCSAGSGPRRPRRSTPSRRCHRLVWG